MCPWRWGSAVGSAGLWVGLEKGVSGGNRVILAPFLAESVLRISSSTTTTTAIFSSSTKALRQRPAYALTPSPVPLPHVGLYIPTSEFVDSCHYHRSFTP